MTVVETPVECKNIKSVAFELVHERDVNFIENPFGEFLYVILIIIQYLDTQRSLNLQIFIGYGNHIGPVKDEKNRS